MSEFQSQFTARYATPEMRQVFSDYNYRLQMRLVWTALATAQNALGVVTNDELSDIKVNSTNVDIEKSLVIEKQTGHDVVAELNCFANQCKVGGGKLHLGATSEDVIGNAQVLQQKQALLVIETKLITVLNELKRLMQSNSNTACMGYTHLQPAEPTTLGYRFAFYAQDLLCDYRRLQELKRSLRGKGFKGAVGTYASYLSILQNPDDVLKMESSAMRELQLEAFEVSNQVFPRKQDYDVLCLLAQVSQSVAKIAFDIRILQSPFIGELSEPFGTKQVGSSAMPFKRNPVTCEKICSLARLVQSYPQVAAQNSSVSLLERTLDDSANRRFLLADSFLGVDEILRSTIKVLTGLQIDYKKIDKNLSDYGVFSATEILLVKLVEKGYNRQEAHELIRSLCMQAWESMKNTGVNPLSQLILNEKEINSRLSDNEIREILQSAKTHTGLATQKTEKMITEIEHTVK